MSCRGFGLGATRVDVYLYELDTPQNAFAVFSGQRRPGSANLPLTANAYATANALFFTQGRFYVELVADKASDSLGASLEAYARALLAGLPAAEEAPDAAAMLPSQGLTADSVRLNAADAFGLEGFNAVLTADYSLKAGEATAFVAKRQSPDEAKEQAGRYLEFLKANGYADAAPAAPGDGPRYMSLDNAFRGGPSSRATPWPGVHDASSLEAAKELAGMLAASLKGEK